jgi:hypothetical protein
MFLNLKLVKKLAKTAGTARRVQVHLQLQLCNSTPQDKHLANTHQDSTRRAVPAVLASFLTSFKFKNI